MTTTPQIGATSARSRRLSAHFAFGFRRVHPTASARQTRDTDQAQRLLTLALIYDFGSRADSAQLSSATVQIGRDWVIRFDTRSPGGPINGKDPEKASLLNDAQQSALAKAIEHGPTSYLDGVVRWRPFELDRWVWEEFRVSISEETHGREVRAMGYRKL